MAFPLLEVGYAGTRRLTDASKPPAAPETYRQNSRQGSRIAQDGD
jgi:hypothetical protein